MRPTNQTTHFRTGLLHRPSRGLPIFIFRHAAAGLSLIVLAACSISQGASRAAAPEPGPSGDTSLSPTSSVPSDSPPASAAPPGSRAVRVVVGSRTFDAELYDNATARDLTAVMPFSVTMEDLHGVEKFGRLPNSLTTDDAPRGSDPDVGEIGYYAPGQALVFYYGDMGYYAGIIRIGRFTGNINALEGEPDSFSARVERG